MALDDELNLKAPDYIKVIKQRICEKAQFRLGMGNFPGNPTSPLEVAADEFYERSGLRALDLPDSAFMRYLAENRRRLEIEAERYSGI